MQNQIDLLYQPLFHYIKKRIRNTEDAQDLTQEVFFKLIRKDYSEISSLKNWLYRIAQNTIIDYYRKNKLITQDIEDHQVGVESAADSTEKTAAHQLSGCIAPFVDQLPDEYREIMQLSELQDIPQNEIADRLSMNYATVRSKVQRGRKKLKDMVSDCCSIEQGGMGSIMNYQQRKGCGS